MKPGYEQEAARDVLEQLLIFSKRYPNEKRYCSPSMLRGLVPKGLAYGDLDHHHVVQLLDPFYLKGLVERVIIGTEDKPALGYRVDLKKSNTLDGLLELYSLASSEDSV